MHGSHGYCEMDLKWRDWHIFAPAAAKEFDHILILMPEDEIQISRVLDRFLH